MDSFYYAAGFTWFWLSVSIISVFLVMLFWDLLFGDPDDDREDFLEGN